MRVRVEGGRHGEGDRHSRATRCLARQSSGPSLGSRTVPRSAVVRSLARQSSGPSLDSREVPRSAVVRSLAQQSCGPSLGSRAVPRSAVVRSLARRRQSARIRGAAAAVGVVRWRCHCGRPWQHVTGASRGRARRRPSPHTLASAVSAHNIVSTPHLSRYQSTVHLLFFLRAAAGMGGRSETWNLRINRTNS